MPCNELTWHRYVNFICACNLVVLLTTFVQSSPVLFALIILYYFSCQTNIKVTRSRDVQYYKL